MKEIKNILICGAGMMGKNIGYVFASNPSFQVGMYDLYPTDVEAGIRTNTRQLLDKGVITEQELSDRLSRISFTNDIDSDLVKNADLVIEAVFEDMKIKVMYSAAGRLPPMRRPSICPSLRALMSSPDVNSSACCTTSAMRFPALLGLTSVLSQASQMALAP